MNLLIIGLVLFFGVHSISIVNDAWRNRTQEKLGEWVWKGIYALIALAGLLLIIRGYGLARLDPLVLYSPPQWLHYVALLLLVPVFPLLLATYLPGRIRTATRHPMLAATKLWAAAHLLVNGTLAKAALDKPVVVDNHAGAVVLGQDLRVGYAGSDGIHYHLFVCESMVLRLDEPEAVCVVTG